MKDVSRETCTKLRTFESLVQRWGRTINLVARKDLPSLAERHIADSLQVSKFGINAETWCDLGSGGGFPGIVVAITRPSLKVSLVESDQRKATFLRTAVRELDLDCDVVCGRSESIPPRYADVVSARALAPLSRLLELAGRHGRPDTTYIFPKGANYGAEVAEARDNWRFDIDAHPSKTDKDAVILILENIERV